MRSWKFWTTLLVAAALVAGIAVAWHAVTRWTPERSAYPLQGMDVSAKTGAIDWYTVRARGADFAYARATQGATERDERFAENWAGMAQAGVRRGAIHVFSLCDDAREQAENFVRNVPAAPDALPAALDLHFDAGCAARPDTEAVREAIRTFLALAEHHLGEPMLILLGEDFQKEYGIAAAIARPIWIDHPYFSPDEDMPTWRMWRASHIRHIEGAPELVNWDVVTP